MLLLDPENIPNIFLKERGQYDDYSLDKQCGYEKAHFIHCIGNAYELELKTGSSSQHRQNGLIRLKPIRIQTETHPLSLQRI